MSSFGEPISRAAKVRQRLSQQLARNVQNFTNPSVQAPNPNYNRQKREQQANADNSDSEVDDQRRRRISNRIARHTRHNQAAFRGRKKVEDDVNVRLPKMLENLQIEIKNLKNKYLNAMVKNSADISAALTFDKALNNLQYKVNRLKDTFLTRTWKEAKALAEEGLVEAKAAELNNLSQTMNLNVNSQNFEKKTDPGQLEAYDFWLKAILKNKTSVFSRKPETKNPWVGKYFEAAKTYRECRPQYTVLRNQAVEYRFRHESVALNGFTRNQNVNNKCFQDVLFPFFLQDVSLEVRAWEKLHTLVSQLSYITMKTLPRFNPTQYLARVQLATDQYNFMTKVFPDFPQMTIVGSINNQIIRKRVDKNLLLELESPTAITQNETAWAVQELETVLKTAKCLVKCPERGKLMRIYRIIENNYASIQFSEQKVSVFKHYTIFAITSIELAGYVLEGTSSIIPDTKRFQHLRSKFKQELLQIQEMFGEDGISLRYQQLEFLSDVWDYVLTERYDELGNDPEICSLLGHSSCWEIALAAIAPAIVYQLSQDQYVLDIRLLQAWLTWTENVDFNQELSFSKETFIPKIAVPLSSVDQAVNNYLQYNKVMADVEEQSSSSKLGRDVDILRDQIQDADNNSMTAQFIPHANTLLESIQSRNTGDSNNTGGVTDLRNGEDASGNPIDSNSDLEAQLAQSNRRVLDSNSSESKNDANQVPGVEDNNESVNEDDDLAARIRRLPGRTNTSSKNTPIDESSLETKFSLLNTLPSVPDNDIQRPRDDDLQILEDLTEGRDTNAGQRALNSAAKKQLNLRNPRPGENSDGIPEQLEGDSEDENQEDELDDSEGEEDDNNVAPDDDRVRLIPVRAGPERLRTRKARKDPDSNPPAWLPPPYVDATVDAQDFLLNYDNLDCDNVQTPVSQLTISGDRKLPRILFDNGAENDPNSLRTSQARLFTEYLSVYVTQNLPRPETMLILRTQERDNPHLYVEEIDTDLSRPLEHVAPITQNNFWDYVDSSRGFAGDDFSALHEYFMAYHTQLCRDEESRNRVAWFLVYWCLTRKTKDALRDLRKRRPLNQNVAVLMHALRCIQEIVQTNGVQANSLWFHPFITGFIDDETKWVIYTAPDRTNYLQLPDVDNERAQVDALAMVLRAHPNQTLIRLSPTRAMNLEFITYHVPERANPYVSFERLNLLTPENFAPRCKGAMIMMMYYMQHALIQKRTEGVLVQRNEIPVKTERYHIPLFCLVVYLMEQRAQTGLIVTDANARYQNSQYICNKSGLRPREWLFDYRRWFRLLESRRKALEMMLITFTRVRQRSLTARMDAVLRQYDSYTYDLKYCQALYPAMDSFGDPACAVSPNWMLELPADADRPNPVMRKMLHRVESIIYAGSLWECGKRVQGQYGKYGSEKKVNLRGSDTVRLGHLWHLVRWLGLDYFQAVLDNKGKVRSRQPTWAAITTRFLKWMLRSGSIYPFVSQANARLMLEQAGSQDLVVVRLSTSQIRGIEVVKSDGTVRNFTDQEWGGINVRSIRGQWFSKVPKDWQEIEYVVRLNLYDTVQGAVLLRNLEFIRMYLESCDFNLNFRKLFSRVLPTSWQKFSEIGHAFLRPTTEDVFKELNKYVQKHHRRQLREWKQIASITINANARLETRLVGAQEAACRPGSYPKMDFSKRGNINKPKCTDKKDWIYKQPLLNTTLLRKMRRDYVKDRKKAQLPQDLLTVWEKWTRNTFFSSRWCNVGSRGDRNKTLIMNWLGADCIRYLAKQNDYNNLGVPRNTLERKCYVRAQLLKEMSTDPALTLLINPAEAELYATEYAGWGVLCLSATRPGWLEIFTYKPLDITELYHDYIDLDQILDYVPDNAQINALPLGLILRFVVYNAYSVFLAVLEEPVREDAKDCNRSVPDRLPDITWANDINFTNSVPATYAVSITSLILDSFAENYEQINETLVSLNDEEKGLWEQVTEWWYGSGGISFSSIAQRLGFMKRERPPALVRKFTDQVVTADYINTLLKSYVGVFQQREREDRQEATELPSLRYAIQDKLLKQAQRFTENEFQGQVKTQRNVSEQLSWTQRLKRKLGFDKADPTKAPGFDDAEILEASREPGNSALVKMLLQRKVDNKLPLGPQESALATELGVYNPAKPVVAPPTETKTPEVKQPPVEPEDYPRYVPPAGPMTDTGGPPFSERPPPLNAQGLPDCEANGNYVYPAFDINENGQVVPRCARAGWMMDGTNYPRTTLEKLDPNNQRLIRLIEDLARHWCPTLQHTIKLWRWLGIHCLGREALDILGEDALNRTLAADNGGSLNPAATVVRQSKEDQLAELQNYRNSLKGGSTRPNAKNISKCKARVAFLSQMISSNILFPYIRDLKNARILSGYNKDRVVVMLDWSDSGQIVAMQTLATNPSNPIVRRYRAEKLVNFMQFIPTTVRLRIFVDFAGGICASNYQFYTEVLKQARRNDCLQSLGAMRRYAVRASLPVSYQNELDRIYEQVVRAEGQKTQAQVQSLNEIQRISYLMQTKNLSSQEIYVFDELVKLENDLKLSPEKVLALGGALYKARDLDHRREEAQEFENLALCQRPEFVPYLRQKLHAKYPELSWREIEEMDRDVLCRTLINKPQLEKLSLPVYLWQIEGVPDELRNPNTFLLDIWNGAKEEDMNRWLMHNYGITVPQLQEWNRNFRNEDQLAEYGQAARSRAEKMRRAQHDEVERLIYFRQYMDDGQVNDQSQCAKLNFTTTNPNIRLSLCKQPLAQMKVVDVLGLLLKNFCSPNVPLLMNDYEFILGAYQALLRYSEMMKRKVPKGKKVLPDQQCQEIQSMYNQLLKDAAVSGRTVAQWIDVHVDTVLTLEVVRRIARQYYGGNLMKRTNVQQVWTNFANDMRQQQRVNRSELVNFWFVTLLHLALANELFRIPRPR